MCPMSVIQRYRFAETIDRTEICPTFAAILNPGGIKPY